MDELGKGLILFGIVIIITGALVLLVGRIPGLGLGHLPGDIVIQRENFTCFFPITSMILVSVVLTIVLNVLIRLLNR